MGLDVSQHGAGRTASNIAFYFDFASPESYLALERFAKSMAAFAPELVPVRERELDPFPLPDDEARRAHLEQLAAQQDVLPFVWPEDFPYLDTTDAVTVATYAKSIGKVAVFSLSLFRQIYAAAATPRGDRQRSTWRPPPPRSTRAPSISRSRARGRATMPTRRPRPPRNSAW